MRKHIAQSDYDYKRAENETNIAPSMTKPDMAMSMPEILRRFASGRNDELTERVPFYESETPDIQHDHPDVTYMSKIDRYYTAKELQHESKNLGKKAKDEEKEIQRQIKMERDKLAKEKKELPPPTTEQKPA